MEYTPIMNNNLTVQLDVRMHQPCEGKDHRVAIACSIIPAMSRVRREIDRIICCRIGTEHEKQRLEVRTERHRPGFRERTEPEDVSGGHSHYNY